MCYTLSIWCSHNTSEGTLTLLSSALRLQSILDGLGCSLERMAPDVCGYVESLSSIASFLNLKDCSDMRYKIDHHCRTQ